MASRRMFRSVAVLAAAALVMGAFLALPAEAGKRKKKKKVKTCAAFTPAEPQSNSEQTAEALEAEVALVTDKNTKDSPLTIEYEHGPALWETVNQVPIVEDTLFYNIQVDSRSKTPTLNLRLDWDPVSESDIDLYMYDGSGAEVESSGAYNPIPVPGVLDAEGRGGMGFESIPGFAASDCAGYTLESRAFTTTGQAVTLTAWLGAAE